MLHPTLVLALVSASAPSWPQRPEGDGLPPRDPAITRTELEHHARFLASDELGGRAPLTAGMERAAQYLARALADAGLEPAGEEGAFFQATGLARLEYPSVPRLLFTHESGEVVEARYGADFELHARGAARATEKLPLRFFYDYNHLRMPLVGNREEALYFSAGKSTKQRILEEKGIANLEDWGLEIEIQSGEKGQKQGPVKDSFPARVTTGTGPEACELVELRGPLLVDFERRRFTHVQLLIEERSSSLVDRNVVGRIRGVGTAAQPELAREVVVFSAHYDHLGIRPVPRGREREDSLFNGADDNASGCAVLLELAQAFAAGPAPARTLLFLFTTGEETGHTGVARYLRAPAEALTSTVANLNLEMLGRPDAAGAHPGRLWLTGDERTNLGAAWREQGLDIAADPRPEQSFFTRSDNYPFALEGVVAQTLSSFDMHNDYHRPGDEADTLDYGHLEAAARLVLRAATTLADGGLAPRWLEGQQPKRIVHPGTRLPKEPDGEQPKRRKQRPTDRGDGDDEDAEAAEDGENP